jgi:hypothetical protein
LNANSPPERAPGAPAAPDTRRLIRIVLYIFFV